MRRKKILALSAVLALNVVLFSNSFNVKAAEGSSKSHEVLTEYKNNIDVNFKDKGQTYFKDNNPEYFVSNNPDYYKKDLFYNYQWDIKRVTNNGASFYIEPGNHEVVVGIIDTGIDTDHPDLKDNLLGGVNFVPAGSDEGETGDPNDIEDRVGHGTAVAGQIAGNGRARGIAPKIGFRSYRVSGKRKGVSFDIVAKAIIRAVDDGVKVINMSVGEAFLDGGVYYTNPNTGQVEELEEYSKELKKKFENKKAIEDAINYAEKHNVVIVTSAGNNGMDCSSSERLIEQCNKELEKDGLTYKGVKYKGVMYKGTIYKYPSMLPNVINVSATNSSDKLASYSNYGQGYITVAAPGGDFVKTNDTEYYAMNICTLAYNNGSYTSSCGTSFAAPKVSAEAALILCQNKNLTPKEVKQRIMDTCDKAGNEADYGAGIINVYKALKKL